MKTMEEDMDISDNDEDSNVFNFAHFEDSSEILRDSRHDVPCCQERNPHTTLSWTKNSCTSCYQREWKNNSSPRISAMSIPKPCTSEPINKKTTEFLSSLGANITSIRSSESINRKTTESSSSLEANITAPNIPKSFSVERLRRQISKSPNISTCEESSPKGSISPSNFTQRYIPKSLVTSSRFAKIKLDCSFLQSTDEGPMALWPGPFHEVDRYWDVDRNAAETDEKHSSFYKKLINRRIKIEPQPPLVGLEDEHTEVVEESNREMIPYYDKCKDRRCPRFVNNEPCSSHCRYLHIYPRDDGVHCKFYYLYRECPSRDCKYIHGRRCSIQTKTLYKDTHAKNRCLNYLYTKSCSDVSCEKTHRLPKLDGIHCFDQLSLECTRGLKCDYKHIDDLNEFLAKDYKISDDNGNPENFVPAVEDNDNDSDTEGPEYYIPSSDSENEYPPYGGVGDTLTYLKLKRLSLNSSSKAISSNNIKIKSENAEETMSAFACSRVPIGSTKNVSSTNSGKPLTLRINNREAESSKDPRSKLPVNESSATIIKQERSLFDLDQIDSSELTLESNEKIKKEKNPSDHSDNSSSSNSSSVVPLLDLSDNHEKSCTNNNGNKTCHSLIEVEKDPPEIECLLIKREIPIYDLSSDDEMEPCKKSEITTSNDNINLNVKTEDENYNRDSSTETQIFNDVVPKPNDSEERSTDPPIRDILSNVLEECARINEANIKVEPDDSNTGGGEKVTDINSGSLKSKEKETSSISKESGNLSFSVEVKTERKPVVSEVSAINNSSLKSEPIETSSNSEGGTLLLPVEVKTKKELDGSEVSNYYNRPNSSTSKRKIIRQKINDSDGKLNLPSDLDSEDSEKSSSVSLLSCKRKEQEGKKPVDDSFGKTEENISKKNALSTSQLHSGLSVSVSSDLRTSLCNTSPRAESSKSKRLESLEPLSYNKESLPTEKNNTPISSNSKCSESIEPFSNIDKESSLSKKSNTETSTSAFKHAAIVDENVRKETVSSKPEVISSSSKGHKMCSRLKVSASGVCQINLNVSSPRAESSKSKKYEDLKSLSNKESLPTEKNSTKTSTNIFPKKSDFETSTHISPASKHINEGAKQTLLSQREGTKASKKNLKSSKVKISKRIQYNLPSNVKLRRCSVYLKNIMKRKSYIKKYNLHKLFKDTCQNSSINPKLSSKDKHQISSKNSELPDKGKHVSSSKRTEIVSQDEHDDIVSKSSKLSSKEKHKHLMSSKLSMEDHQSEVSSSHKPSSRSKYHGDSKTPKLSNKEKHYSSSESLKLSNKEIHGINMSPKITNHDQILKRNPKSSNETKDNSNSKNTKPSVSMTSTYSSLEDKEKNSPSSNSSIISDSSSSISNSSKISNSSRKKGNKDTSDRKLGTEHDKQRLKSFESHVTKDSSRVKDLDKTKRQKQKDRSGNEKVSSIDHSSKIKRVQKDSSKASVSDDNSSNTATSKDKSDTENFSSPFSKSSSSSSSSNSSVSSFISKQKEKYKLKSHTKDKLKSDEVKLNSPRGDKMTLGKRPCEEENSSESSVKKIKVNSPRNSDTSISIDKKSPKNSQAYKLTKKKRRLLVVESSEDSDDSSEISGSRNTSKKARDSSENLSSSDQSVASERVKFSEKHSSSPGSVDSASQKLKSKNEGYSSKAEYSSQVTHDKPISKVKSLTRLQRPCPLSKKRNKESEAIVLAKATDIKERVSLPKENTSDEKSQKLSKVTYKNESFLKSSGDVSEETRTRILKEARETLSAFIGDDVKDENIPKTIISLCKELNLDNIREDESILSLDRNMKQYLVFMSIKYQKLPPSYYYDAPYHLSNEELSKVLKAEVEKLKEPD